jgi:hypothetical protein
MVMVVMVMMAIPPPITVMVVMMVVVIILSQLDVIFRSRFFIHCHQERWRVGNWFQQFGK